MPTMQRAASALLRRRLHRHALGPRACLSSLASRKERRSAACRRPTNHPGGADSLGAPPSKDDWREWFRSSDYDDPWSPYVPCMEEVSPEATRDYQQKLVSSVVDGTWKRRRHGMNLEPLRMLHRGVDVGELVESTERDEDGSNDASADQQTADDILQDADVAKARERLRWLDAQTRFLCRMLDDLYRTGIRRENDRPRTERCHRAMGKLLIMTPENPTQRGVHPEVTFSGLAQRAGAIVQRMEQCSPPALRRKPLDGTAALEGTHDAGVADGDASEASGGHALDNLLSSGSYQGVYPAFSPHLSHTKYTLPAPTRQIYNMVLKSYAKESGPIRIAQQAEDVVWSMIVRAMQQPATGDEFDTNEGDSGNGSNQVDDGLFPSIENWNCVLKCWSRSSDPDRAFHAYSFLLSWVEWNAEYLEEKLSTTTAINPDVASFQLVIQSCLVDVDGSNAEECQRMREMGSGVAIRLWKVMPQSEISLDSTTYRQIIRAICQTPELPSPSSKSTALQALVRVFTECQRDGMSSPEIKSLVQAAMTESQFARLEATLSG